jgi:hypothetical protein
LSQIPDDLDPQFNFKDMRITPAGAVYPGFAGSSMLEPVIESSAAEIGTILDAMTVEGVGIGFSSSNVDLEWRAMANLGAMASGSSHVIQRATDSLFYWRSINANVEGEARIDWTLRPISADGVSLPWTILTSQALTITPAVSELYKFGPAVLTYNLGAGNVSMTLCNDGWTWSNNVEDRRKACSGSVADRFAAIRKISPTVELATEHVQDVLTFAGSEAIVSLDLYLIKLEDGGIQVASATAEHIKFSTTAGTVKPSTAKNLMFAINSWTVDTTSALP